MSGSWVWLAALVGSLATPQAEEEGLWLRYHLPRPAQVSLQIEDTEGRVVRSLLQGAPRPAGSSAELWDGRDRDGRPLPPASYRWRLLAFPGLEAEYLGRLGSDLPAGQEPGHAAFSGSADSVAIAALANRWVLTNRNPEPGAPALAMHEVGSNRRLASLENLPDGAALLDVATDGENFWILDDRARLWKWLRNRQALGKPLKLAASGDRLAVSDPYLALRQSPRRILLLDLNTGSFLRDWNLEAPLVSMDFDPEGHLLLLLKDRLLQQHPQQDQALLYIEDLKAAEALSVNRWNGHFWIADGGRVQQILHFADEGTLLQAWGKRGGRSRKVFGLEEETSFAGFADLAATPDGGLFAWEGISSPPQRFLRFAPSGTLMHAWYPGEGPAPQALAVEGRPDQFWLFHGSQSASLWQSVPGSFQGQLQAVYPLGFETGLDPGFQTSKPLPGSHSQDRWKLWQRPGQSLFVRLGPFPAVIRFSTALGRFQPLLLSGGGKPNQWPATIRQGAPPGSRIFLWVDWNRNGYAEWNEVRYDSEPGPRRTGFCFGPEEDLYFISERSLRRYPLTRWWQEGSARFPGFPEGEWIQEVPDRFFAAGQPILHWNRQGKAFWAGFSGRNVFGQAQDVYLGRWVPQSDQAWSVGGDESVFGAGQPAAGALAQYREFLGSSGQATFLTATFEQDVHPGRPPTFFGWDRHGLWVGGLMDRIWQSSQVEIGHYQASPGYRRGLLYQDPASEVTSLLLSWQREVRRYQIRGWRGWHRQSGSLQLEHAVSSGGAGFLAEMWNPENPGSPDRTWLQANARLEAEALIPRGLWQDGRQEAFLRLRGEWLISDSEWRGLRFHVPSGMRFHLDGKLLIDTWDRSEASVLQWTGKLQAGRRYTLQWELRWPVTGPAAKMSGIRAGGQLRPLGAPWCFLPDPDRRAPWPAGSGWVRTLSIATDSSTPSSETVPWLGAGLEEIETDPEQVAGCSWTGALRVFETGLHSFRLTGPKEAAALALKINGRQVQIREGPAGLTLWLDARHDYAVEIQAQAPVSALASISLEWRPPRSGFRWQKFPSCLRFPAGPKQARPPVRMISPRHDSVLSQQGAVRLEAGAGGTELVAVEFFVDGKRVGRDSNPPYQVEVQGMEPGFHQASARGWARNGLDQHAPPVTFEIR
ncbi:MAG: hypothetical protein DWQ01_02330 [Planctomycetota bacterium]|nr:MAG: hypothetical protein DWQ01_02330 [Planctomycetota bacterium]